MKRVLLLLPARSYRTKDFLEAAAAIGVEVTVGTDEPPTLESLAPSGLLTLEVEDPAVSVEKVVRFARAHRVDAVLGTDEATVELASALSRALDLPGNDARAARAARDKLVLRRVLRKAGVPVPRFQPFSLDREPSFAEVVSYPCVLKPLMLSASRGVMRADDAPQARERFLRLKALMDRPEHARRAQRDAAWRMGLVEDFAPGPEVALEGLVTEGRLQVLALFDKPDPLDGPFFAETLYVTPSRHPAALQESAVSAARRAVVAMGLRHGPVHAELRLSPAGPVVLEVAGRTIGGLCSRALRFGAGISLEELVLRHALGLGIPSLVREGRASGVMMLPVPRAGVVREVRGLDRARSVAGGVEAAVTVHRGQKVEPLPEGDAYMGFLFARGGAPAAVEETLREAARRLEFVIEPE